MIFIKKGSDFMEIIIAIIIFIFASIGAACKGDTSGIEVIFSILLVVFVLWLICKTGIGGVLIIMGIFFLIIIAIASGNSKGGK